MKSSFNQSVKNLVLAGIAVAALTMTAQAQPPEGGPPPGFGGPGQGGPGGGGPRGRQPRPMSVAQVPMDVMDSYLGLSESQHSSIEKIIADLRATMPRPPARPQPGEDNGQPPQRPSREEMEARRAKMDAADKKASAAIEGVLTVDQKKKLPTLVKALGTLRRIGFALPVTAQLKLTNTQLTKLAALGQDASPDKIEAVLTADQKQMVQENQMRRGPGGPGGPGGPPPGGGDGPPLPPGGEQGGPGGPPSEAS